jgi:hypothetical protein
MATREHLTPRSFGGSDETDNLVAACEACNMARGRFISPEAFHAFRQHCLAEASWPPLTEPRGAVRLHLWAMSRRADKQRQAEGRERLKARSRKIGKIRAAHARDERAEPLEW